MPYGSGSLVVFEPQRHRGTEASRHASSSDVPQGTYVVARADPNPSPKQVRLLAFSVLSVLPWFALAVFHRRAAEGAEKTTRAPTSEPFRLCGRNGPGSQRFTPKILLSASVPLWFAVAVAVAFTSARHQPRA